MIFISFPIRMGLGKKGEIHMAENAATLKCIRTQVLKFQSNWYVKLAFPALYAEMLIFIAYMMVYQYFLGLRLCYQWSKVVKTFRRVKVKTYY